MWMELPVGRNRQCGRPHPVADLQPGEEEVVYADAGHQGNEQREEMEDKASKLWFTMRPGKRRSLPDTAGDKLKPRSFQNQRTLPDSQRATHTTVQVAHFATAPFCCSVLPRASLTSKDERGSHVEVQCENFLKSTWSFSQASATTSATNGEFGDQQPRVAGIQPVRRQNGNATSGRLNGGPWSRWR